HLQRFYQESRATAALSHPNIVQAFDVDHDPATGDHFMAMEYIDGKDLQRVVAQQGRVRAHQAADYIRQAALGLQHAHERGMVHRDIKPGNLLVDNEGRVRVLDMGIARILEQEDDHSLTLACKDQLMGTIDYIAPEQLNNPHLVDGRADVYALGCTLFFLLAGHPPFHTGTLAQRLMKHQITPPPDLRPLRPDVPHELIAICEKMLAKKAADRYQSAGEVAEALQDWLDRDEPSLDAPPPSSVARKRRTAVDHTVSEKGFAAEKLLADLLAQRVLTPLQAEIISGQRREPLTVHGYQLLEQIPEGRLKGMYRGRHGQLHFPVCLKLLWLSQEPQERERQLVQFQHEARVASQLQHPNVVKTYEVGREGDLCYAMLENLIGQTMADFLTPAKRPTLSEACRMIREAALGLAHMHEMDVVHRNICPSNLWVGEDGTVKVMDFTLARDSLHYLNAAPIETVVVSKDEIFGAADYVAPEQAIDCQDVSPQSDIYGLGCTLYHALTGRAPFGATNTTKLML
ncbi:MAG TPA: serine/threonine-protein kinase, partial [Pirellulales bacterium]